MTERMNEEAIFRHQLPVEGEEIFIARKILIALSLHE